MAAAVTGQSLSETEVAALRDALAAGRRPKVVFTRSAGQIAGQLGQVVRLDDPAESSEWIVVRFGRDELPFSPGDVAIPPKATPARRAPAKATVAATVEPVVPAPRVERAERSKSAPADPPPAASSPPVVSAPPAARDVAGTAPVERVGERPDKRPAKATKPKPPASLTVTLAYTDREWTVAATQGSKTLAKPCLIRPTEALRMVALLDVPAVHEAVESIIASERAEAEQQAQRLRAELADIEARLSELTSSQGFDS